MKTSNLHEVAAGLKLEEMVEHLDRDTSRLIVTLVRQLAQGQPISLEQARDITSKLHIPLTITDSVIQRMCERDQEGNIVGLMGLSLGNHSHVFRVNGHSLTTWCAWDALFLPYLLDQTAEVESACPVTQEKIQLTVTPHRVEDYTPASAVISMVAPKQTESSLASVESMWMAFCNYVHFFSSREAVSVWFSTQQQESTFLSIDDGLQLGRIRCGPLLRYVEA